MKRGEGGGEGVKRGEGWSRGDRIRRRRGRRGGEG